MHTDYYTFAWLLQELPQPEAFICASSSFFLWQYIHKCRLKRHWINVFSYILQPVEQSVLLSRLSQPCSNITEILLPTCDITYCVTTSTDEKWKQHMVQKPWIPQDHFVQKTTAKQRNWISLNLKASQEIEDKKYGTVIFFSLIIWEALSHIFTDKTKASY